MSSSKTTIQILPTCVPQSAEHLRENIAHIKAFSRSIHVDIDDGIFTPHASWPFNEQGSRQGILKEGNSGLDMPIDTTVDNFVMQFHLMVSDGRVVGENFIQGGAQSIILHVESSIDTAAFTDTLGAWSMLGVKEIGIAILLDTPLENLVPLLPFCDFVHVLSVASIGAQGAPFDSRAIERVAAVRALDPDLPIEVDGGVSLGNIASLVAVGASRFAIGSAIATAADPAHAYRDLKAAAEHALQ